MKKKTVLFYTFLIIFIATSVITLLGVVGVLEIKDFYLKGLFLAFLIELAGTVIAVYRKADFFSDEEVIKTSNLSIKMPANETKKTIIGSDSKKDISDLMINDSGECQFTGIELKNYIKSHKSNQELIDYDDELFLSKFKNLLFKWQLQLETIRKRESVHEIIFVQNDVSPYPDVTFEKVRLEDFPTLKFSKENDILLVEGEILSVENSGLHIIGKLRKIEKT